MKPKPVCKTFSPLLHRAALLLLLSLAGPALAAPQFPAAGRVGLQPPPGMIVSGDFAGFEDRREVASIVIAEMPSAAYASLDTGLTTQALATKGIVASGRTNSPVAGAKSFLIHGTQTVRELTFNKWLLVVGNDELTALVTVQVRRDSVNYSPAAIEAALRTIAFKPASTLEQQIAALPFRVTDRAGFRAALVLAGALLMLTEGPKDIIDIGPEQPVVAVGSGLDRPPSTPLRDAFARNGLMTMTSIREAEIDHARSRTGDWHEIEAHALDKKTGEAVRVLQIIHFLPQGWIRTVGVWRVAEPDRWSDRVRKLAASVESK